GLHVPSNPVWVFSRHDDSATYVAFGRAGDIRWDAARGETSARQLRTVEGLGIDLANDDSRHLRLRRVPSWLSGSQKDVDLLAERRPAKGPRDVKVGDAILREGRMWFDHPLGVVAGS